MSKFEIKSWVDGNILFAVEAESWKIAVELAVKSKIDLRSADLSSADLRSADLSFANLSFANLSFANLSFANLRFANLRFANLSFANLSFADLSFANLRSADLRSVDLRSAKNISKYIITPLLFLLDQPGSIRAYKLIKENGEGSFHGGINYLIGEDFVDLDVDTNENLQCGKGINLATLDWCMKEWETGYRILVMEFTASDIAAIPTATDGKFRVRKCKRVGEKDLVEIGLIPPSEKGEILNGL